MFSFFNKVVAENSGVAYDYSFNGIEGGQINLSDYKDKVIVVVNVASRCGYTPQYEGLQTLYNDYKNKDVIVIGVPTNNFKQEPGTNDQIKDFCETTFGISFPMTEKINVIGANSHPFYKWARKDFGMSAIPKWNFHKIVIGKNGKIEDTFASFTKPTSKKFIRLIEKLI
jgi:glutathione peroxidase